MRYLKLVLAVAIVLAVVMVGYVVAQDEPQAGGVLQAATDAEWTGLDPHVASTVSSFVIIANAVECDLQ